MRTLVVGSSAAAHALVWKLFNSERIDHLTAVPGNAGAGLLAPIAPERESLSETLQWAYNEEFRLIVPAESRLLMQGLTDEAHDMRIAVWGGPKRSAWFERSRLWLKEFLLRHNLPCASGRVFTEKSLAERYLAAQQLPVTLWSDIPSEFDGAYTDRESALNALAEIFALPLLEHEGAVRGVVIEAPLIGPTVSFSCFCDGTWLMPLLPVRSYERLEDGDSGWAAQGMGGHTSDGGNLERLGDYIYQQIMQPLWTAIQQEQLPWWGILGVDCVITATGPKIAAIRTTFGDPEAQVVLPRLENDLMEIITACQNGTLSTINLRWRPGASVGVTRVALGYPHNSVTGLPLVGLANLEPGVMAFQSRTYSPNSMDYVSIHMQRIEKQGLFSQLGSSFGEALSDTLERQPGIGGITSRGGRIVTVVALGANLAEARSKAYANVQHLDIRQTAYRSDIAAQEL